MAASVALWAGIPLTAALVLGVAVAMSSTAIVLKQLRDRGELHTRHGRLSVAVLIFQDLATLPLLAMIPASGGGQGVLPAVQRLGIAALAFVGLALLGRWLIRPLFRWVAAQRSMELFMLSSLLTIVGAAMVAQSGGLSAPLGAFLAGMVLGETQYRHQIEADLQPFQAVLLGLFFASVGMLLDPTVLSAHWIEIVAVTAPLVIIKSAAIAILARVQRHEWGVAYRCGLMLGHGGEFGLLLISVAMGHALLPDRAAQMVLAAIVASMFLAPLLIHVSGPIARALAPRYRAGDPQIAERIESVTETMDEHVIVCGFGRTGQNVAQLLRLRHHPYVALDLDPSRVHAAPAADIPVAYGDATRRSVLEAAGVERARALVITFDEGGSRTVTIRSSERRSTVSCSSVSRATSSVSRAAK